VRRQPRQIGVERVEQGVGPGRGFLASGAVVRTGGWPPSPGRRLVVPQWASVSSGHEDRRIDRPKYWKHQLRRELNELRLVLVEEELDSVVERTVPLERFAFVTAFIMRKLAQGQSLTVEVTEWKLPVQRFTCIQEPPGRAWFLIREVGSETWRQPIEQHYDLERSTSESLSFERTCDLLIHHFAFESRFNEGRAELLFNSDHTTDRLYAVALEDYKRLVTEAVDDEVRWVDMDRSINRVIQRRTRPPSE
jgi:hypothetical protein